MTALNTGQAAGGDSRGMQSAALLVVKEKGGYGGYNDRYIDLRVDEHPDPINELIRIFHLQQLYFAKSKPERVVEIKDEVELELTEQLKRNGYYKEEDTLYTALKKYIHTENFEMREQEEGKIDLDVLEYMKSKS